MSNQANNEIQLNSTIGKPLELLPTETNASEQALQELNAEQLEEVAGAGVGSWFAKKIVGGAAKGVVKGAVKTVVRTVVKKISPI